MKKYFFILIIIFLIGSSIDAQELWKIIQDKEMPFPVSAGQIVYNGSKTNPKFYILGGYSNYFKQTVDWIQEYDVITGSWRFSGRMNTPRSSFVACLKDSTILYFGGAADNSDKKDIIESWNIISQQAPAIFDRKLNFDRKNATGYISNNNLYIIGGNSASEQTSLSYIVEYNLLSKQETFTLDFPSLEKPQDYMSFLVNDYIYFFGGVYNGVNNFIKRFTLSLRKMDNLPELLLDRRAGGSGVYNPRIKRGFVIGGYNEVKKAMRSVELVTIQPDNTLLISSFANLNYERKYCMALAYENNIYVFGGNDINNEDVRQIEVYTDPSSDVKNDIIPNEYNLMQNYPNPFNPETVISYQLPVAGKVSLKVYDILGREVATLVDEFKQSGVYNSTFNTLHSSLTSGVYFYKIEAGGFFQVKKMVLLK